MRTRTSLALLAACALAAPPAASLASGAPAPARTAAVARGQTCKNPFALAYQRGFYFRGDTRQIRITSSHRQIATGVSTITFRWRALRRNRICAVVLVDNRGRSHRLRTGVAKGSYSFRQGEGPYPFRSFTITAARHR
jgi:hypothetical protein